MPPLNQIITGTWIITYNGENRPIRFENAETQTVVECGYDSQGRRFEKKVTVAGTTPLHHRYIYRGYLQIAALDLTRAAHPALWLVTWDPSQPTATRPLALQKDGTWFTYGYDITKNICEVFGPAGYIRTAYSYTPFGSVSASENGVVQNFQWSSEFYDSELDLVYYNYRHYSPSLGRFLSRDPIAEQGGLNLYAFVGNRISYLTDLLGLNSSVLGEIEELLKKEVEKIAQNWEARLEKEVKKLIDRSFRKALREFGEPNIDYSDVTLFPIQKNGGLSSEGFFLSFSGYVTSPTLIKTGIGDNRYSVRGKKEWRVSNSGISSQKSVKISDNPKVCGWEVKFGMAITENAEINISYNGKSSYDSFSEKLEQSVSFVFTSTF
ncbi:MAG: RHS repeat-associated core domain-containing protein [Opitutales bacterium]|nr:RHS repeat-associated core domain-containing protein [Opitutales bacterium]